jgi:hypothetical protein
MIKIIFYGTDHSSVISERTAFNLHLASPKDADALSPRTP